MASKKTMIERIFRDYLKRKMRPKERKILLGRPKKARKTKEPLPGGVRVDAERPPL